MDWCMHRCSSMAIAEGFHMAEMKEKLATLNAPEDTALSTSATFRT
jgi:hypothetical protein